MLIHLKLKVFTILYIVPNLNARKLLKKIVPIKAGTVINPSMPKIVNSNKKKITNNLKIINPAIPSPINILKPTSKPITQIKSNLIQNPIYPILNSQAFKNLVPLEKTRKLVNTPVINEKKDADISELLKGHKNIIENETKLIKIARKKKKTLKSFLSPLQIAAYNTYNPTPDKIERLTHRMGNVTPNPLSQNIPSSFKANQYNQQIKTQQMNVANAIETAKLLSIVQNELDTKKKLKKNKKLKKKNAKKQKKKESRCQTKNQRRIKKERCRQEN